MNTQPKHPVAYLMVIAPVVGEGNTVAFITDNPKKFRSRLEQEGNDPMYTVTTYELDNIYLDWWSQSFREADQTL